MMRSIAVLATAVVVVVAFVIVGGGLLDRSPGVGGPPSTAPSAFPSGPSPSQSQVPPSVGPTDTPRPTGPQAYEEIPGGGRFEPGTYTISSIAPLEIMFTVPAGWERPPNAPEFFGPTGQTGREIGGVSFWTPAKIQAVPCPSSEDAVVELPPEASAEDVVSALAGLPGVDMSSPKDVTVGGFAGTYLEMTSPCSNVAWVRFWVVDVDGVRVVMVAHLWTEYAATPDAVAELEGIVDSVQIEPRRSQPS